MDPVPKEAGAGELGGEILLRAQAWIARASANCSLQVYLARDQADQALHLSAPVNRVQHELLATVFQTIAGETNLSSSVMAR